jgi:hypothetical protein
MMGGVGVAEVVNVSRKGTPGGPQRGRSEKSGGGVPTGVGEGTIVGVAVADGEAVGVTVAVPGSGVTVGVTRRSGGIQMGLKKPLVEVT